jgi:hypothetical protein
MKGRGGAQVLVSLSGASVVDVVLLTERNVPYRIE